MPGNFIFLSGDSQRGSGNDSATVVTEDNFIIILPAAYRMG
jgi:hypothetical protein